MSRDSLKSFNSTQFFIKGTIYSFAIGVFYVATQYTSKETRNYQWSFIAIGMAGFSFYYFMKNKAKSAQYKSYLTKPTGQFGVGFEDFSWINSDYGRDKNFNGSNARDFSLNNRDNYSHEARARIYYPISLRNQPGNSQHYFCHIKSQNFLGKSLMGLTQFDKVRTFAHERQAISSGQFPVIIFLPGLGVETQRYENIITELVSHGYIVVGINSLFISGDIQLSNGRIVEYHSKYRKDQTGKYDPELNEMILSDLKYIFKMMTHRNSENSLFAAMDLDNMGLLGHSIGGNIVAKAAHGEVKEFRAAATLDIGYDESEKDFKEFTIPFMHIVASTMKRRGQKPDFKMAKDGFVVEMSPDNESQNFSAHFSFTDASTLQYLPWLQIAVGWSILTGDSNYGSKGNGWDIARATNIYLVNFFDKYMKGSSKADFSKYPPPVEKDRIYVFS